MRADSNKRKQSLSENGSKPSLQGWIKRRRVEVDALGANFSKSLSSKERPNEEVVGRDGWTQKHQAELQFQGRKRAVRFIEAVGEGTVAEDGLTDEMRALIASYMKLEKVRDHELQRKLRRPRLCKRIQKDVSSMASASTPAR